MAMLASMRCMVAILAALVAAAPALAADSIYTSLEGCRILEQTDEGAYARLECPAPEGWGVELVDFDGRSHLILSHGGEEYSLERDMVLDFPFGQFPGVGQKAEWRMGAKGPQALIVRMYYTKDEAQKSVLFVYGLQAGAPKLLGTTTSNEKARQIADGR